MDNFFGSNSKGALQDTIRHQQEKLGKYEKKLGDLVKAYKVLQEEKKALQETVSAFSNNPTVNESSEADENNITDDTLKNQVAALTKTLSSLNETKNTLEQRFQNDKKVLLDQIQNLNNLIEVEMSKQQSLKLEYENAIQSLKNKLRHEQHEREQEQTHHVAMLREIQHMLASERNNTQKLEMQLNDIKTNSLHLKGKALMEEKINLLTAQKRSLEERIVELEASLSSSSSDFEAEVIKLRKLQEDTETMKSTKEGSIYRQLNIQTSADQNRIRDLENRLTELSDIIAEYDHRQKADLAEIQRLQTRVTTLELDSSKVERVHVCVNTNVVVETEKQKQDSISSPSPTPLSTSIVPISPPISLEKERPLFTKTMESEIAKSKEKIKLYQKEVKKLQDDKREQHQHMVKLTGQHKQELEQIQNEHAKEMIELDRNHSTVLFELQESSKSARLRSQQIISDKDDELTTLRAQLSTNITVSDAKADVVGELLTSVGAEDVPRTMVFYRQQYTFLKDELESVKGSKDSLELCLREKERNEHVYVNEVSELKKEIRRLIRNSSRESANLEYLKNIMLRYLRATSSSEKRQILLAIFTILEFNDEERHSVKHKLAPSWFS